MAGGADQLDAALVGLVVGLGADEAGQEAVVDVEDLARIGGTQLGRQDLHVAGQHHGVAVHLVEDALDLGVGAGLVVGGDRHVVEGDAVPLDETPEGVVVGDHAGDLDVELLRLPAGEQVVEAVLLLRDEDHDALLDRRVGDLPVHLEFFGDGGEALAELGEHEGQRVGADLDAHEVAVGLAGVVVAFGVEGRFEDPALVFGDEAGNLGDDPGAVRAGGGEGVEAFAVHGGGPPAAGRGGRAGGQGRVRCGRRRRGSGPSGRCIRVRPGTGETRR